MKGDFNWKKLNEDANGLLDDVMKMRRVSKQIARDVDEGGSVTYDQTAGIREGFPMLDITGATTHRIFEDIPDIILFHIELEAGCIVNEHDHPDAMKWIMCVTGDMTFDEKPMKLMKKKIINPKQRHGFYTRNGCLLIVAMKKQG